MTIAQIIRQGKGKAGSGGAWRVYRAIDHDPFVGPEFELWHYGTLMAVWTKLSNGVRFRRLSLGNGSVSDQGGMNTLFRELSVPYRYSRAGGASIINHETGKVIL